MIRKLTEQDRQRVMDFLLPEKEFNIFIIGDIENHGFSTDFQELWGDFDDIGFLRAVLLRYMQNAIMYSPGVYPAADFGRMIVEHPEIKTLMGKTTVINALTLEGKLCYSNRRTTYLARLQQLSNRGLRSGNNPSVRVAGLEDVPAIVRLHSAIEEFNYDSPEEKALALTRDLQSNSGRAYVIQEGGDMVSTALTTAENSSSALIRGVATATTHRNKGLATACTAALCRDLQTEGKTPCLFYDNPAAGSIYRRMGFQELGTWEFCFLPR